MPRPLHHEDLRACERLAIAVYSLMDHGRYEDTAELFTEDGVWIRGGSTVQGRDAILRALRERPDEMLSRHLVTNVLVEADGDHAARATACFVPLRGEKRGDGTVAMQQINMIGDLDFRFRREAERWQITRLQPKAVFQA